MNTPLKLRKINLVLLIIFTMLQSNCKKEKKIEFPSTVTDIDGNIYHTVLINEQVWMVENLKTIHFQNGDSIPNVVDDTLWSKLTTPAYCDFSNNSALSQVSGRLYNHSVTVDGRKICPPGWHIPNSNEWGLLSGFLGGGNFAGGKMKETGLHIGESPILTRLTKVVLLLYPVGCEIHRATSNNMVLLLIGMFTIHIQRRLVAD